MEPNGMPGTTREQRMVAALRGVAVTISLLASFSLLAADPPPPAAAAGFKLNTFSSRFNNAAVDLASKETPGIQWYPFHFFHSPLPDSASLVVNPDGSVTLGTNTVPGPASKISIATAAPSNGPSRWTGQVFGGGAYFEAALKFDPRDVIQAEMKSQWPAFWSMAIEHLAELAAEQWKGQAKGYNHFIELDFFEYDVWKSSPQGAYGGAVHDWYGVYKVTCPGQFCKVNNAGGGGTNFDNFKILASAGTDFRQYHKFGVLWVPATDTSQGYAEYYFDDKKTADKVTWTKFRGEPPPPGAAPWTFGVIDQQHLAVILDSGPGQPMTVKSVNVWQSSPAGNLRQ
jgi:hypothetical protein